MPITLSSRSVRRTVLAAAATTLSIALAACGASFNAQTSKPYQAAEGTNADSGSIGVRNMLVLADQDGKGELHTVVVNNGDTDDTLVGIEQAPPGTQDGQAGGDQPAAGSVTFSKLAQPLNLKAGTSILLPSSGQTPGASPTAGATPTDTPSPADTPTPSDVPSTPGSTELPPGQTTPGESQPTPGGQTTAPGQAGKITVTGAKPGQMVNVTITFGKAAPITTYIPILTTDHFSPSAPAAAQ